ncbi:amidophosphoribosyltransferase [Rubrobacter xylanophilus]|uniref:Amidophosphoribosyltransferase n=1 Tax=Rubrobacter xylanophilus TaxID=49319 RepID=A0A510HGK9_9ACTN|nr:ComF family protein [Rubrobacter xylanophilus]BBL79106.1 amidophosphoribosyltransferase [Rubrobacter xylanophilus]
MGSPYLAALLDLLYPQRCAGCGSRASDVLCRSCAGSLPLIEPPLCSRCGLPAPADTPACSGCRGVELHFEGFRAPLRYEGVGREVVHALKYQGYTRLARALCAPLMASVLSEGRFDLVVPVPLHPSRQRRRGYNQAALLARALAGRIGVPFSDKLKAVRRTRDQVELTAAGRRENVRGAFESRGRVGGRVLLVDDVLTTGATMSECARVLLEAGASAVYAVGLCRAR